jgi:hypothetical protein
MKTFQGQFYQDTILGINKLSHNDLLLTLKFVIFEINKRD